MNDAKTSAANSRKPKPEESEAVAGKKDSTNAIPMFDIEEALKLVVKIHDKALETAPLPQVAKGCGYATPTSTPFYRRLAAARLFKLLASPQAELTSTALDYLKPDREDAKQAALTQAIMAITAYADLVQRHVGKKINTELVSHSFSRTFGLTDSCAGVPKIEEEETDEEIQTQTLYLDSKRKRRITIKAPLTVTKDELERIRAWLGFQLIVEETNASPAPE